MSNVTLILTKASELAQLESDLRDVSQCLEFKNLACEELQNDVQYRLNQVERMELEVEEARAVSVGLSEKLEAERKRLAEFARERQVAERELAEKERRARESEALQQLRAAAMVKVGAGGMFGV